MIPNLFIVGAPKCGTTALATYLDQHPNIYMSSPKEPNFFCPEFAQKQHTNDIDEYLNLFRFRGPHHRILGEASVWYLLSPSAADRIHRFNPDARIIIMLRNPIDLVYSLHSQLLWTLDEDETSFFTAWDLQGERAQGRRIPPQCREPHFLQYETVGQLGTQVARYYAVFPKDQILTIFFEDFVSSTRAVFEASLAFLGLPHNGRDQFPRINANKRHRSPLLARLSQRPPRFTVAAVVWLKAVLGIRRFHLLERIKHVNSVQAKRPPLPAGMRQRLGGIFKADIEVLEQWTQRNLDHWK
ncbi:MAG: sulfotransferase [Desulfosarcinaceae bacterium]|nr:sulfotransferase [Desulfosarcinaceae bacterium]